MSALEDYYALEIKLLQIRKEHGHGVEEECPEEEALREQMDAGWNRMTQAERETRNAKGAP